jgi:hypothetical protein
MRRTLTAALLLLNCCLLLHGCGKRETIVDNVTVRTGEIDFTVERLNSFTVELTGTVESAPDTSAGIVAAQKLLDARKAELTSDIAALKKNPTFQQDAAAKRKWLEAEVDSTDRVNRLQVKYLDASMRDREFKERLDRLVADYDAMFNDR